MKPAPLLTVIWTILCSALFNSAGIAANDRPTKPLIAVYCHSAEPLKLSVCSVLEHHWSVLSRGVTLQICADGDGRIAALQESGAIVTYNHGSKTRTIRAKNATLVGWSTSGLMYKSDGELFEFSTKSGLKKALSIEGDIGRTAVGHNVTFLVQRVAGSTKIVRLESSGKTRVLNTIPANGFSSMTLAGERLILLSESASNSANADVYVVNTTSGSFRRILSSEPVTAICPFGDYNHLVWGALGHNRNIEGMSPSTEIITMDLLSGKRANLARVVGQVSPIGQSPRAKDIVAIQQINAHGPGNLISLSADTGKVTVIQTNVYNAYPAR